MQLDRFEAEQELNDIIEDLKDLPDSDDEDDGWDEDCFDDTITIRFPDDCAKHPGAQHLTLSVRDVLTMFEHFAPEHDAQMARAILEAYYSGPELSSGQLGFMYTTGGFSPEERAAARWRASRLPKAEEGEFPKFDSFGEGETETDRLRREHPGAFAKTDEEAERQYARGQALDAEYDTFVAAINANPPPSAEWIAACRADLQAKTDQLIVDNRTLREEEWKVIEDLASRRIGTASVNLECR